MASDGTDVAVAVRSSATAEDLPEASFAGQQETFLNVRGRRQRDPLRQGSLCVAVQRSGDFLSGPSRDFRHADVALSAGIQRMVRSDIGASGVIFTIDTESGFPDVVFVTASWGLGELVVQGAVNPDEFYVYKPALSAGKCPILRRTMGTKLEKMIYADSPRDDEAMKTVPSCP
jgi:pyruvate, water dikinase